MENLLQNKYVLYLILFFAVTNVLGYLAIGDFDSIVIFAAIVLLTSYFSKNMIIILGLALLGTNIIYANNGIREGLKNKKKKRKRNSNQVFHRYNKKFLHRNQQLPPKKKKMRRMEITQNV